MTGNPNPDPPSIKDEEFQACLEAFRATVESAKQDQQMWAKVGYRLERLLQEAQYSQEVAQEYNSEEQNARFQADLPEPHACQLALRCQITFYL